MLISSGTGFHKVCHALRTSLQHHVTVSATIQSVQLAGSSFCADAAAHVHIPYDSSTGQQHVCVPHNKDVEAEGGDNGGIRGQRVDAQVANLFGSDGATKEHDAANRDEVDSGRLWLSMPPGKSGQDDEKRGHQRRRQDP